MNFYVSPNYSLLSFKERTNSMEAIVIGIAVSFNMLIIYWKLEKKRIIDALLDGFVLFMLSIMFGQSTSGMIIATVASAIISLFLLIKNPQLPVHSIDLDKNKYKFLDKEEWRKRL